MPAARISEEPNVDLLRRKANILESENLRLSRKVSALLRENLRLRGMEAEQVELNLPGLLAQASGGTSVLTRAGSERRPKTSAGDGSGDNANTKDNGQPDPQPKKGHGPTAQLELEVVAKEYDLDEADKTCPTCGDPLKLWEGHDDVTEVIDVVERRWVVRKATLKKYRCQCGGCVETAEGPSRLIKGGRYTPEVGVAIAVDKYVDHIPLERQVRMARRQGALLTSQTLWDQLYALSLLLTPLYERIKSFILEQPVIGVDESPFKLIKKGGSVKWQAWQMSCAMAVYFEILPAKSAEMGSRLLGDYSGEVVADGAKAYESLARAGPFSLSNCWSHGRRNVLKAEGEAPGQVAEFLALVGELYAIERKAAVEPESVDRRQGYRHRIDLEKLRELRHTESRKVIGRLKSWMEAQKCIPGGQLKASLKYIAGRWTPLTRFLDNPLIPLDNNRTEGGFVGLALGRRNYIGARSERGMLVAAKFYTFFESARICGVDPQAYLRYATQATFADEVPALPHEWKS